MKNNIQTVYAFSSGQTGGNPAGIFINADGMTDSQMQNIAAEIGLSETAFISKSKVADFKLDFFTPTRRIADCGHATVAAFAVLKKLHPELRTTSKEIVNGVRNILVEGSTVYMEQPFAKLKHITGDDFQALAKELFLTQVQVKSMWLARHDNAFLLVELESETDLRDLKPNQAKILDYSHQNDLIGIYVYLKKDDPVQVLSRMFAPAYGIPEESATGMAAGLLTTLFWYLNKIEEFVVEQGRYMIPSAPSLIFCRFLKEKNLVLVGGESRFKLSQP